MPSITFPDSLDAILLAKMPNFRAIEADIGFQDSLDAFILAMMPCYREFKADLWCRDLPDYFCTFVLFFALFCTNILSC